MHNGFFVFVKCGVVETGVFLIMNQDEDENSLKDVHLNASTMVPSPRMELKEWVFLQEDQCRLERYSFKLKKGNKQ